MKLKPRYAITKNYGPDNGLSATFRQWRATSHCRFIHGYALGIRIKMSCDADELDENGWVLNFGGLKPLKAWLADTFDHKTLVAKDDPALSIYQRMALEDLGIVHPQLIQLVVVEATGCEAFAKMVYEWITENILADVDRNVCLDWVEVYEHGGNSAFYGIDL